MKLSNSFYLYQPRYSFGRIPDEKAFVSRDLTDQSESVVSAFNDIHESLYKLKQMKSEKFAESIINSNPRIQFRDKENTLILHKSRKSYYVTVQKDRGIIVREQSKPSGNYQKSLYIKDRQISNLQNCSSDITDIKFSQNKDEVNELENYLKTIFDEVDITLLNLRKKIRKNTAEVDAKCPVAAVVSPELVNQVIKNLNQVKSTLSTQVPMTRVRIRNEYPLIKKNERGSQAYEFKGIGPSGEDMSVNVLAYENEKLLVIKIDDKKSKDKLLVINEKGEILKKHLKRFTHGRKSYADTLLLEFPKTKLYQNPDFSPYLEIMKKELGKYNDFLTNRIKNKEMLKEKFSTSEIGSVKGSLSLIDDVYKNYMQYKKNIHLIKDTPKRNEVKKKMRFETQQGQPSLIMRNITPEKEHLFINFPMVNNERCTKILLLDENDKIKKTLFVQGDKLLKFDAKNIHRSQRNDNGFHYHSQEYIDNCGLDDYLKMINKKLKRSLTLIRQKLSEKNTD